MTEQEAIKILSLDEKEKKLLKNLTPVYEVAIKALKEIQQYRAIGTPEECRAALEKQIPKKIIKYADGTEHCPTCDCDNSCIGYGVCIDCGQKLDWSDEE